MSANKADTPATLSSNHAVGSRAALRQPVYLALAPIDRFSFAIDATWVGTIVEAPSQTGTPRKTATGLCVVDLADHFGLASPPALYRRAIRLRPAAASTGMAAKAQSMLLLLGATIQVQQVSFTAIQPMPRFLRSIVGCGDLLGLVDMGEAYSFLIDIDKLLEESV